MMKKIGLACIGFLAVSINLFGQSDDYQKVRIGVKVAPAVVWLKPNTKGFTGNGSKLGFSYGLMLDFNFSKNYGIATGLDVTYRGGKLKDKSQVLTRDLNYNLQYVQLPVTIKLKTNEIGYMTYFGQLGFETGFNIVAKGTNSHDPFSSNNEKIRDQIVPFNMALLIVAGAELSLSGHTSLMVSAYFSNGFIDIIRATKPNFDARSNGVGLNVGVFF